MRMHTRFVTVMLAVLISGPALAQRLPRGVTRGASVEGITEYRLDNGLQVLLFPDESKPTVTVNVTYFVGSRHEGYGETGMAHLLEHLLFKGTPRTPNVPQALVDHGAEPNGTTWFDRTNYFETLPATDENLRWALSFEADRMVNSFVAQKDLQSEMTVVRNEYEMGETNPQRVLLQRTMGAAYLWHNYGNPTIGARSDIEKVSIGNLRAFYKKYYQPDNALLVVAGRFKVESTIRWISESFGKLPRPRRVLPTTYTEEPTQDGERQVVVRRTGGVQALTAMYHVPHGAHADFAALDVLTLVLGDSPSGRLYKALVETKKATQVSAHTFQLKDPGVLFFGATVLPEVPVEPAQQALLETVEGSAKKSFSKEEVDRARSSLLKEIELTLNASDRVGLQLSEWAAMGDWRMLFVHRDRLMKVTEDDVAQVAKAYLKPSNRTLGLFVPTDAPDRSEMPRAPDVAPVVKDYKGKEALSEGEAFEATTKNIEARVRRSTLSNGMKVAFLEKKTRGETVAVTMTLRLGSEKALLGKRVAGEFAARMLSRGTKKRTRAQWKDALDEERAQVSIDGNATSVTVSVEARRAQLAKVLSLVTEALKEPAFDEKEFEQLKAETMARIKSQKSEPVPLAQQAFRRHLEPWDKAHPYYMPTFEEAAADAQAISLKEVRDFFAQFYGAQSGEVAVVGDFDAKAVGAQLETAFAPWKAAVAYERIPKKHRPVEALSQTLLTPDKANAVYFTGTTWAMRDSHQDYPALVLADFLLGGGFLNSRLAQRLRQTEGLSYGAGSFFRAHPLDEDASLGAYAIYAPTNVGKVETAMKEEFSRALKDGFSAEEVTRAKSGLLQKWQNERSEDAELARTLATYLFLDRTFEFNASLEQRVSELKWEAVHRALRQHVTLDRFSTVKAGDFSKKSP